MFQEGKDYSLVVEQISRGKYVGNWTCLHCGLGGGSSSYFPTEEDAKLQNSINYSAHGSHSHPEKQLPPK